VEPAVSGWTGPPPAEICLVMLSAIGDAVHVLPVANALKRAWPESRITWIIQPVPHTLVKGHAAIDDFIVFHRRRGLQALAAYRELMDRLRDRRFDLLIGLQVYFKAGLITGLAPARIKLGFDRARARDGQWLFTNRRIPPHPPQHVQDQYLEFLTYLGVDPEPVVWDLRFTEEERVSQREFFDSLGAPACAFVVGTSKPEKNWTPEGYAAVMTEVERTHGLRPVIVGGPSAIERGLADRILATTGARVADALGDDLRRLAWLLDGSALVVSPDTGPLHMARALGTPCVSLFGYTNPKRYAPYRAFEDLVVDGYAEYPGEDYPSTHEYRDGMRRITVDRVLQKVARAMTRHVGPAPGGTGGRTVARADESDEGRS
jgi:heptosyltransferase I